MEHHKKKIQNHEKNDEMKMKEYLDNVNEKMQMAEPIYESLISRYERMLGLRRDYLKLSGLIKESNAAADLKKERKIVFDQFVKIAKESIDNAEKILDSSWELLTTNPDAQELFEDDTSLGSISDSEAIVDTIDDQAFSSLNPKAKEWPKPPAQDHVQGPKAPRQHQQQPKEDRNSRKNKNQRARKPNETSGDNDESKQVPNASSDKPSARSHPKPNQPRSKKSKPQENKKAKRNDNWWNSLTDLDPITMEPLCELSYPPFAVPVPGQKVHYFDGAALATYLVSVANFINPNNRLPLTRQTCVALDAYLKQYGLPEKFVTAAFNLSKQVRVESSIDREVGARRDATAIASNLFSYARDRPRNQDPPRAYEDANFQVIDGNAWVEEEPSSLDDLQAFPTMAPGQPARSILQSQRSQERVQDDSLSHGPRPVDQVAAPTWVRPSSDTTEQAQEISSTFATVARHPVEESRPHAIAAAALLQDSLARSNVSRSSAIFGDAKPREEVIRTQESVSHISSVTGNASIAHSQKYLCPYLPSFMARIREMGISWISRVEREVVEFCKSSSLIRSKALPVMNPKQRALTRTLVHDYYGLESRAIDPEGQRQLIILKKPDFGIPECSLVDALYQFDYLMEATALQLDSRKFDGGEGTHSILMMDVQVKVTSSMIDHVFEKFTRASSYFAHHINGSVIAVEFHERHIARKVYAKLAEQIHIPGKFWGILQWWPISIAWAQFQLDLIDSVDESARDAEKFERKRQAAEKKKELEKQRLLESIQKSGTGWHDEKETDLMPSVQVAAIRRKKVGGPVSFAQNKWGHLQNDSSSEDESD